MNLIKHAILSMLAVTANAFKPPHRTLIPPRSIPKGKPWARKKAKRGRNG